MSVSAQDLLDSTNTAIQQCLTAQDYSISGRQKRMADLAQLRAFRQQLLDEIQSASDGPSMCSLGIQTRPSL